MQVLQALIPHPGHGFIQETFDNKTSCSERFKIVSIIKLGEKTEINLDEFEANFYYHYQI